MIVDNYLVEYNMMKSPLTANRSKKVFITNRLGKYTRVFFVSSDHERRIASDRSAPDEYSFDISSGYELSFFYRGSTLRYTTSCREWESLTWCNHRSERKEIDKNWVSSSGGKIIYNSNMVLLMKQPLAKYLQYIYGSSANETVFHGPFHCCSNSRRPYCYR